MVMMSMIIISMIFSGGYNYQTLKQKPSTVSFRLIAYDHHHEDCDDHHEDFDDHYEDYDHLGENYDNRYEYQTLQQKPTNKIKKFKKTNRLL